MRLDHEVSKRLPEEESPPPQGVDHALAPDPSEREESIRPRRALKVVPAGELT